MSVLKAKDPVTGEWLPVGSSGGSSGSGGSSNVIVAKFETGGVDTSMCCTTHTAQQLFMELDQGRFPVLANVYDRDYQTVKTAVCWIENVDRTTYVKVGCWGSDSGWSHAMDNEDCYLDGDISNKTIGNELWMEY